MDSFEMIIVFSFVAHVLVTSFILGRQYHAEGVENQEGEPENNHYIEAGLPEGDMGDDDSATDEQGPSTLQLAQATNRHEETTHIESPVANLETEGQEEEQIAEVARQEIWSEMHSKVVKFGSKIGIWATGISVPGTIAILATADRDQRTSLCHSILLLASTLAMLTSFISGGILLIFPLFHVEIFPPSDPKSTRKIKTTIGVAIGSMALGVSFVTALILQVAN